MGDLQIVPVDQGRRYQVLDDRGVLVADCATETEAQQYRAGYRLGLQRAAERTRWIAGELRRIAS